MADLQVAPWILAIPVKRTAIAKSRLASAYPQHRPELARAFAVDTTAAALASPLVCAVLVVTDDPVVAADVSAVGARVVPDLPSAGLNEALLHGATVAAAEFPGTGVVFPYDRFGGDHFVDRGFDVRAQPVDAGGATLRHYDIAVSIEHQARQSVGLAVHQPIPGFAIQALAQAQRDAQPVHEQ